MASCAATVMSVVGLQVAHAGTVSDAGQFFRGFLAELHCDCVSF
jgi:hypothetical protein